MGTCKSRTKNGEEDSQFDASATYLGTLERERDQDAEDRLASAVPQLTIEHVDQDPITIGFDDTPVVRSYRILAPPKVVELAMDNHLRPDASGGRVRSSQASLRTASRTSSSIPPSAPFGGHSSRLLAVTPVDTISAMGSVASSRRASGAVSGAAAPSTATSHHDIDPHPATLEVPPLPDPCADAVVLHDSNSSVGRSRGRCGAQFQPPPFARSASDSVSVSTDGGALGGVHESAYTQLSSGLSSSLPTPGSDGSSSSVSTEAMRPLISSQLLDTPPLPRRAVVPSAPPNSPMRQYTRTAVPPSVVGGPASAARMPPHSNRPPRSPERPTPVSSGWAVKPYAAVRGGGEESDAAYSGASLASRRGLSITASQADSSAVAVSSPSTLSRLTTSAVTMPCPSRNSQSGVSLAPFEARGPVTSSLAPASRQSLSPGGSPTARGVPTAAALRGAIASSGRSMSSAPRFVCKKATRSLSSGSLAKVPHGRSVSTELSAHPTDALPLSACDESDTAAAAVAAAAVSNISPSPLTLPRRRLMGRAQLTAEALREQCAQYALLEAKQVRTGGLEQEAVRSPPASPSTDMAAAASSVDDDVAFGVTAPLPLQIPSDGADVEGVATLTSSPEGSPPVPKAQGMKAGVGAASSFGGQYPSLTERAAVGSGRAAGVEGVAIAPRDVQSSPPPAVAHDFAISASHSQPSTVGDAAAAAAVFGSAAQRRGRGRALHPSGSPPPPNGPSDVCGPPPSVPLAPLRTVFRTASRGSDQTAVSSSARTGRGAPSPPLAASISVTLSAITGGVAPISSSFPLSCSRSAGSGCHSGRATPLLEFSADDSLAASGGAGSGLRRASGSRSSHASGRTVSVPTHSPPPRSPPSAALLECHDSGAKQVPRTVRNAWEASASVTRVESFMSSCSARVYAKRSVASSCPPRVQSLRGLCDEAWGVMDNGGVGCRIAGRVVSDSVCVRGVLSSARSSDGKPCIYIRAGLAGDSTFDGPALLKGVKLLSCESADAPLSATRDLLLGSPLALTDDLRSSKGRSLYRHGSSGAGMSVGSAVGTDIAKGSSPRVESAALASGPPARSSGARTPSLQCCSGTSVGLISPPPGGDGEGDDDGKDIGNAKPVTTPARDLLGLGLWATTDSASGTPHRQQTAWKACGRSDCAEGVTSTHPTTEPSTPTITPHGTPSRRRVCGDDARVCGCVTGQEMVHSYLDLATQMSECLDADPTITITPSAEGAMLLGKVPSNESAPHTASGGSGAVRDAAVTAALAKRSITALSPTHEASSALSSAATAPVEIEIPPAVGQAAGRSIDQGTSSEQLSLSNPLMMGSAVSSVALRSGSEAGAAPTPAQSSAADAYAGVFGTAVMAATSGSTNGGTSAATTIGSGCAARTQTTSSVATAGPATSNPSVLLSLPGRASSASTPPLRHTPPASFASSIRARAAQDDKWWVGSLDSSGRGDAFAVPATVSTLPMGPTSTIPSGSLGHGSRGGLSVDTASSFIPTPSTGGSKSVGRGGTASTMSGCLDGCTKGHEVDHSTLDPFGQSVGGGSSAPSPSSFTRTGSRAVRVQRTTPPSTPNGRGTRSVQHLPSLAGTALAGASSKLCFTPLTALSSSASFGGGAPPPGVATTPHLPCNPLASTSASPLRASPMHVGDAVVGAVNRSAENSKGSTAGPKSASSARVAPQPATLHSRDRRSLVGSVTRSEGSGSGSRSRVRSAALQSSMTPLGTRVVGPEAISAMMASSFAGCVPRPLLGDDRDARGVREGGRGTRAQEWESRSRSNSAEMRDATFDALTEGGDLESLPMSSMCGSPRGRSMLATPPPAASPSVSGGGPPTTRAHASTLTLSNAYAVPPWSEPPELSSLSEACLTQAPSVVPATSNGFQTLMSASAPGDTRDAMGSRSGSFSSRLRGSLHNPHRSVSVVSAAPLGGDAAGSPRSGARRVQRARTAISYSQVPYVGSAEGGSQESLPASYGARGPWASSSASALPIDRAVSVEAQGAQNRSGVALGRPRGPRIPSTPACGLLGTSVSSIADSFDMSRVVVHP